jgi:hypothetical protein
VLAGGRPIGVARQLEWTARALGAGGRPLFGGGGGGAAQNGLRGRIIVLASRGQLTNWRFRVSRLSMIGADQNNPHRHQSQSAQLAAKPIAGADLSAVVGERRWSCFTRESLNKPQALAMMHHKRADARERQRRQRRPGMTKRPATQRSRWDVSSHDDKCNHCAELGALLADVSHSRLIRARFRAQLR